MNFDHVITWQIKKFISQLSWRLQSSNLEVIRIRTKPYITIWYLKTSESCDHQLGVNTNQNEEVPCLHATWPSHAKVIKTAAPKIVMRKAARLHRLLGIWFCDILVNEERHITIFVKVFKHQSWMGKHRMKSLGSKMIQSMLYLEIN